MKQGRKVEKVYIALFTCASTRAVHLELVEDNTSESFLRAFKRYVSRRSFPSVIYSDNATTFRASADILMGFRTNKLVKVSQKQRFNMEIYCSKGTMVWWVLGALDWND